MEFDAFLAAAVDLLAVQSTEDRPEELRRAVEQVVDYVGPGFMVEWFERDGKPSALLYAERYRGADRPEFRVVLNGHLDVVPAAPEQFRPRREGDRLYARGTQDMKISALLQAQVFRELAAELPYPLALQLVADEEIGGRNGTLHQLEQGVAAQFVVIGEHSGLNIVADAKGALKAELRAEGLSGHGAYPWLGDNALVKIMNTVTRLLDRYPVPTEEVWRTTITVARVDTPNRTINQIPGEAEAWLDIRFPAEDADFHGKPLPEIAEYLSTFAEPGVTVTIVDSEAPQQTGHDRAEVKILRRAAQAQGFPAEFIYKHGGSDAGFYTDRGTDAVAFGVEGAGQHGPEEYAEISTFEPYYRALKEFLKQLAVGTDG
jgi:succinyl-diaminopimelate desuccinylase